MRRAKARWTTCCAAAWTGWSASPHTTWPPSSSSTAPARVRAARGRLAARRRATALLLEHYPTLREAMDTRRARVYREEDHLHGDGDPFDAVLGLPPGHSCLVAPLYAGDETYGVLTLDRTVCEAYAPSVVNLVEVYAQLLAIAIQAAGHKAALERLHRQDHVHAKLLEEELAGDPSGWEASKSAAMQRVLALGRQVAQATSPGPHPR